MTRARDMRDEQLEIHLKDGLKNGAFEPWERGVILGCFKRWRSGKDLSEKQDRLARDLVEKALMGSLVEDDHG